MTIANAQLYVCTDARVERGDFAEFVDAAFAGGVDIIQLRDKTIDVADELAALEVLAAAADRHGALWAVNDRADVAAAAGAPVLHLGQRDLPTAAARHITGAARIGLSTHSFSEVNAALANPDIAYFCTGPVWATPTKPGRASTGLGLVSYASARAGDTPWFAIGGIDASNVAEVVDAGASRIVVVRAITEADDPTSAARGLRDALPPLD